MELFNVKLMKICFYIRLLEICSFARFFGDYFYVKFCEDCFYVKLWEGVLMAGSLKTASTLSSPRAASMSVFTFQLLCKFLRDYF